MHESTNKSKSTADKKNDTALVDDFVSIRIFLKINESIYFSVTGKQFIHTRDHLKFVQDEKGTELLLPPTTCWIN